MKPVRHALQRLNRNRRRMAAAAFLTALAVLSLFARPLPPDPGASPRHTTLAIGPGSAPVSIMFGHWEGAQDCKYPGWQCMIVSVDEHRVELDTPIGLVQKACDRLRKALGSRTAA